ncbi:unnamed protein product, partial [Ectocarpus sp. 4 AP-2014]
PEIPTDNTLLLLGSDNICIVHHKHGSHGSTASVPLSLFLSRSLSLHTHRCIFTAQITAGAAACTSSKQQAVVPIRSWRRVVPRGLESSAVHSNTFISVISVRDAISYQE